MVLGIAGVGSQIQAGLGIEVYVYHIFGLGWMGRGK